MAALHGLAGLGLVVHLVTNAERGTGRPAGGLLPFDLLGLIVTTLAAAGCFQATRDRHTAAV